MPIIHEIAGNGYWTGASREIGEKDPSPRGWTRASVPQLGSGEYAVWNGRRFSVTQDPPPPTPGPDFADINRERERRLSDGSAFSVTGIADPVPLTGRPFDQTVYLALLTRAQGYKAAGVVDPVLTLRDGADTIHSLTPDQMIELISQAMTWVENVMARSWAMKDATAPFEAGIPTNFTSDEHWP